MKINFIGKYHAIVEKSYVMYLKFKYRKNLFRYEGAVLNPRVKIYMSNNGTCCIGNIWAGAGQVSIKIIDKGTLTIGNNVCINSNCVLNCRESIKIGNDVMFGPNVAIFDHDHDYTSVKWKDEYKSSEIEIGNNVWLSSNVTILRGTKIGDNCVIGAGAVIKGKIESNTIVYAKQDLVKKQFTRN